MASGIYTVFKTALLGGVLDLDTDTIKVGLLDDSHSFNAANTVWGDVSANEVSGAGYTAGGATLASATIGTAGTTAQLTADDTSWTSATFSAYHAVLHDVTATEALLSSIDFGGEEIVASGTFTIEWDSSVVYSLA